MTGGASSALPPLMFSIPFAPLDVIELTVIVLCSAAAPSTLTPTCPLKAMRFELITLSRPPTTATP